MRKWIFLGVLAVALAVLTAVAPALAQEAPPALQYALDDLSARVGATVAVENLDSWFWEHQQFGDTSLGCPQPDQAYAQVLTSGYQFMLTYGGVSYDYRVSDDGSIVILCGATQLSPTPTAGAAGTMVPTPQGGPSPTPTLPPTTIQCPPDQALRLTVGDTARLAPGMPGDLRAEADANAQPLGSVTPGATFQVIGGPTCTSAGAVWWQVSATGQTGWIAQGAQDLFFVERVPQALPALTDLGALAADNLNNLQQLTALQGNVAGAAAWSPDGAKLALASTNPAAPGVWIYDLAQVAAQGPTLLPTDARATAVAYTPDGNLAVGLENGSVAFWPGAPSAGAAAPLATLPVGQGAVRAITFSPDGRLMATVSEGGTVRLWGVPSSVQG